MPEFPQLLSAEVRHLVLEKSVLLFIEDDPDPFREDWGLYDKHDLYYAIDAGLARAVSSLHMQCWRHNVSVQRRRPSIFAGVRCSPLLDT